MRMIGKARMVFCQQQRFVQGSFLTLVLLWLFWGAAPAGAQPFTVFVSIAPQEYFVERIGGALVHVSLMVPPGVSPHVYEPKPAQMRDLADARLYFTIGVEFENVLLPKISSMHPDLRIVHTDAGIQKIPMIAHHHESDGEEVHAHGHGHDEDEYKHGRKRDHGHVEEHAHALEHAPEQDHGHDHQGLDSHIWLSPALVRIQAKHILNALVSLDSAHASVYEANYSRFMVDLDALDADIRQTLAGKENAAFMVFHPAWGYFARHYNLEQIPVEMEGKEPRAQDLQTLIQRAKSEQVRVVFVSPQFSTRSAETIAQAINGQTIAIDPLARNWMENMRIVAEKFKKAMQ